MTGVTLDDLEFFRSGYTTSGVTGDQFRDSTHNGLHNVKVRVNM